jgi:methenyltetrahydromethanopterin cyclohydrolase
MQLNAGAFRIAESIIGRAAALGVECRTVAGVRVVDCGVKAAGSIAAGLDVSRAALADLGSVRLEPAGTGDDEWTVAAPDCGWPLVAVESGQPLAACLASQYAGWKVSTKGYFAMASGPIRAAIGREDLYDSADLGDGGMRERPDVAVGLLESGKLPPEDVCLSLATAAGVPPERVILLVARTASIVGTLQVIARSLETALHKLHELRFDLRRIRRGSGRAPLAPVPDDDLVAIGRTNDAILYGGHVVLEVGGDDESLLDIGPRMVSRASADYGEPFSRLFEKAGRDFYALDPALFAPALVDLVNADTGRRHRFGSLAPAIVRASFTSGGGADDRSAHEGDAGD